MKTFVKGAALALLFALIQGCGGNAAMPDGQKVPAGPADRGYGEQAGDQISGAVSSLESEEESGGSFATMVDMLRGRVPGLEISESPTGEINVRIRGDQSVLFNDEPLLVVNDMPVARFSFSSTLRTMDPRTVQSVQVLKDTGSTAIYGSRGAHGVILIRLKKR